MTEPQMQRVENLPGDGGTTGEGKGVKDVDMDPDDHLSRPDQPDFDPAEREPFEDPDPDVLPTASEDPDA